MSSNKKIKDKMIKIFGKKCFIEELRLRRPEEISEDRKRYTGKYQRCIMDQLTYHHILERCKGGKATVENGALLRNINHIWFHRLSKDRQRMINRLFQEYKKQFYEEITVVFDEMEPKINLNIAQIEATDKGIKIKKLKAEQKRELQRLKKEYEDR